MLLLTRRAALRGLASSVGLALLTACSATPQAAAPPVATAPPKPASTTAPTSATPQTAATTVPPVQPTVTVSAPAKPAAGQPRSGGALRNATTADVATLDPYLVTTNGMETSWLVFDRLTAYDANLKPQPMLAESWDFTPDFQQFKLNLRKGVMYHSGREMTADDVKYSLLRPRDPSVGNGILTGISNWFTSIETPDKYTVVIKTDVPRPGFFDGLEIFNICDKANVEGPDAKTTIVGTGPFMLVERAPGDHFTFGRNPNYWQSGRPYLDSVITNIRSQQNMILQLEGGSLDSIKIPLIDDFARLKSDSNYVARIAPNSGTFFEIGINTKTPPLDDKRVRQALNYALDRQRFTDSIFKSVATPVDLPWSQSSPAFDASKNNVYPYDLDKARALLKDAGVGNFETDILVIGIAQPQLLAFTQIYQASLAQIGVTLNIKNMEQATWLDVVINKKPDYTGFWGSSDTFANVSPGSLFSLSPGWRLANNHSNFVDDTYTALVNSVSTETDPAKQKAAFASINDFMLDQSFTMPISTNPITLLTTTKVHDIDFLMHIGALGFTNAWIDA
ncbi:MAG: ABC transporter substrate-binding protein [Chloroflexi bacterium]|nr:ABC transporter substrate-binding protein [Chloroflexota bacterium]